MGAQKAKQKEAGAAKKASTAGGGSGVTDARKEMSKTKEQLNEEMKIALSIKIKPLDLDAMDSDELKRKAEDLFNVIVQLETDKYDFEQRRVTQDYELKELKERQKVQLRQKALKKGLDPEALTGKHPPKIQTASKFERRTDRRTYDDKKKLFEGGWDDVHKEEMERFWQEKYKEFMDRTITRLPKWFGERPGRKAGDDTPEEGEEGDEPAPPPPPVEEPEPEEESEEEEEEEEEGEEEEEEE